MRGAVFLSNAGLLSGLLDVALVSSGVQLAQGLAHQREVGSRSPWPFSERDRPVKKSVGADG
jgi:hypothetical protein